MPLDDLLDTGAFAARHIGIDASDERHMLDALGLASREALVREALPDAIRQAVPLDLPAPRTEAQALSELRALAARNEVWRSFIGTGYCNTHTPPVIQRNVLENPGWYTAYTPYQAEISQGTAGGAGGVPADADRSDGIAGGERVAPRRSHRRSRGDGTHIARDEKRRQGVLRGCRLPPPGDRGGAHSRALARGAARRRGRRLRARPRPVLRRAPAVSGHHGEHR